MNTASCTGAVVEQSTHDDAFKGSKPASGQDDQMIGKNSPNFLISSQNSNIKPLETFEYLTTNHVLKLLTQVKM
jgi:hypothetical protein